MLFLKKWLALFFSICFVIFNIEMKPIFPHALDIEFNVNSDGSVTISGGEYPSLTQSNNTINLVNSALQKYKTIAVTITGFCFVTAFIIMIFMFTKLGTSGSDDVARKKAIGGILTTGISITLLGSATLVLGFFYHSIGG